MMEQKLATPTAKKDLRELQRKLMEATVAIQIANKTNPWMLPEPITVRLSSDDFDVYEIQGLQASPQLRLYILGSYSGIKYASGDWKELEASDVRAQPMIEAIHKKTFQTFKNWRNQ